MKAIWRNIEPRVSDINSTDDMLVYRELHWHPNADEWSYFIRGSARVTIFASSSTARTFDYTAGDVGIVPVSSRTQLPRTAKFFPTTLSANPILHTGQHGTLRRKRQRHRRG